MTKASRYRSKPVWQPTWTPKIESWTAGKIKENTWRFDALHDFDDVMQEARILFWKLEKMYPIVNEPSHFFALYKTSLLRSFTDRSRLKQKSPIDQEVVAEEIALNTESPFQNYGYLNLLLHEMPDELKTVLGALTSGRIRLKLDRPTIAKRHRENHNMRLRRRISMETIDPVGDLRAYFFNS